MKDDLQIAFNWFTHPNGKAHSYLSPNGNQTMDAIRTALSTHSLEKARQITHSVTFNMNDNQLEAGEILVWAAIYALYLGEVEYIWFAKELFQDAAAKYSDDHAHYRAITMWLLGFIYWQFPEYKRDAFRHWEYSLRVLTNLSYSRDSLNPGWYQKIRFQVIESLFQTRMLSRYFPLKEVKHIRLRPTTQPIAQLSSTTQASKVKPQPRRTVIRSIPVYQYVPAGGWGVVNPDQVGQIEVENFYVDGTPYHALDLMGRGRVILQDGIDYVLVRIKGMSMNLHNIQDEDYVLLRRQDSADHKDIVLAERENIDPEATLKNLFKQGNVIELHPNSDALNPETGKPFEKLKIPNGTTLHIRGIAIAVLKPAPKGSKEKNGET